MIRMAFTFSRCLDSPGIQFKSIDIDHTEYSRSNYTRKKNWTYEKAEVY